MINPKQEKSITGREKAPFFMGGAMPTGSAGLGLAKLLASPGAIGVIAGAVCFLVLWPKSPKEGVSRIAISGLSSHVFGNAVRDTIIHWMPWLANTDIQAASYILAAVPAWWILGAVIKYLNRGQDIKEIVQDVINAKSGGGNGS